MKADRPARLRTFADLNLGVVNMRQHLSQVAHVEQRSADRAIAEMIGLGFGNAVGVDASIAACFRH
jgi:hypothetical protein